jgi:hypothetical protein
MGLLKQKTGKKDSTGWTNVTEIKRRSAFSGQLSAARQTKDTDREWLPGRSEVCRKKGSAWKNADMRQILKGLW